MTKYILIMKDDGYKNRLEFESDDLGDVVANMEIFLKGCGFIFEGALDIHTGRVENNAMHYVAKYENDNKFDDRIKHSDELGVIEDSAEIGVIEDGNP